MTSDGKRGFVSLWNASSIAELDLATGRVRRLIPLRKPAAALAGGSHPTALLLNRDNSRLFVALTNRDEIAVLDTASGKPLFYLSTKLPGQQYGGSDPESLTVSQDEKTLYSANAISDSVGVFDLTKAAAGRETQAAGFIPTEWYPTVVAATAKDLLIGTNKGRGSGPNGSAIGKKPDGRTQYPYGPAMIHGSLARIPLADLRENLAAFTKQVSETNSLRGNADRVAFANGENKIRHVIYIIKENRTYDQVFGDLGAGNGDASLTMYGEEITPNQHKLARQFGILDNFYDSGDVSGDGHVWSTSASISDYIAKTWPIGYRGHEHTYDSEGTLLGGISVEDEVPDAGEPTGGYLWKNFATHGVSYRHYGEYVVSRWCNKKQNADLFSAGPPKTAGGTFPRTFVKKSGDAGKNAGGKKGLPRPTASVADNDLAIGRVVDAVSHSPYWEDTAFLILEDDAQDGPDHVDSHRSIALVISKYSPAPTSQAGGSAAPFVDHSFYTTINVVRTSEALLGWPPMNSNDWRAAMIAPRFGGSGQPPPVNADYRHRE